jgi:hypothetical protein
LVRSVSGLTAAYRSTTYWVDTAAGAIALRVGRGSAALDRLLKRRGVRTWAFVTACNPRSRRLPAWRNFERQRRLERLSRRLGFAVLPGVGAGDDPAWAPEPSFLILGISRQRARRLARSLGQNAIVAGRRAAPPELVWCSKG